VTDFTKLVDEVLEKAKPDKPKCKVCGGPVHVIGWNSGKEQYACSSVKSINDPKDLRPFDPGHYANSQTEAPYGTDIEKLRKSIAEAFGKVEAETEKRVREELQKIKKKKDEKELLLEKEGHQSQ
jgi:hypothetical protein